MFKKPVPVIIFCLMCFSAISCWVDHGVTYVPLSGISYQVVDHTIADLTASQVESAGSVRIYLEHASVGGNISGGLNTLQSMDSSYDRSNFVFLSRGNPGWQQKIDGLYDNITGNTPAASDYDAITMKYCYIDTGAEFVYYRDRMLQLETLYPDTVFVWWTIPITTSGSQNADNFNAAVRNYCIENNKILFDIADIECHSPDGIKQTNASGYEIMYSPYTSDGGHLNATGSERVARGFWQLAYIISRFL